MASGQLENPLALTASTLEPDRNFALGIPQFSTWVELVRMGGSKVMSLVW